MSPIRIVKGDIIFALEDHSGEINWYLDKETGEIFCVSQYDMDSGEDEYSQKLEEAPDRYLHIQSMDSSESYRIMEDFIFSLSDRLQKDVLNAAISLRRPFFHFKQALRDFPETEKEWFKFNDAAILQYARDWLEARELDFQFVDYGDTS